MFQINKIFFVNFFEKTKGKKRKNKKKQKQTLLYEENGTEKVSPSSTNKLISPFKYLETV